MFRVVAFNAVVLLVIKTRCGTNNILFYNAM